MKDPLLAAALTSPGWAHLGRASVHVRMHDRMHARQRISSTEVTLYQICLCPGDLCKVTHTRTLVGPSTNTPRWHTSARACARACANTEGLRSHKSSQSKERLSPSSGYGCTPPLIKPGDLLRRQIEGKSGLFMCMCMCESTLIISAFKCDPRPQSFQARNCNCRQQESKHRHSVPSILNTAGKCTHATA